MRDEIQIGLVYKAAVIADDNDEELWKGEESLTIGTRKPNTLNSVLVREWHAGKNGNLVPESVTSGSHKKVWWICEHGHEWQARINGRTSGSGCPYCSGQKVGGDNNLSVKRPDIAGDWHPDKNGNITPADVTPGSHRYVWWICEHGHEWQAAVSWRTTGRGCPYCSGRRVGKDNNLAVKRPDLAGEWHPHKNGYLTSFDVTPSTRRQVWWICQRGHEWLARVQNRSRNLGTGCPYCHKKGRRYKQRPVQ